MTHETIFSSPRLVNDLISLRLQPANSEFSLENEVFKRFLQAGNFEERAPPPWENSAILLRPLPDNVVCIMFALASFGCDHRGYSTILLRRLPFCCLCCVWADSCMCEMCGKNPRFCCGCCRLLGLWLWIASWVNSTILLRRLPFCCLCCVWADSCVCEMCGKNPRFCCGCCRLGVVALDCSGFVWENSAISLRRLPLYV